MSLTRDRAGGQQCPDEEGFDAVHVQPSHPGYRGSGGDGKAICPFVCVDCPGYCGSGGDGKAICPFVFTVPATVEVVEMVRRFSPLSVLTAPATVEVVEMVRRFAPLSVLTVPATVEVVEMVRRFAPLCLQSRLPLKWWRW